MAFDMVPYVFYPGVGRVTAGADESAPLVLGIEMPVQPLAGAILFRALLTWELHV